MTNKQLSIAGVIVAIIACFLIVRYTMNSNDSPSAAGSPILKNDWIDFTAPSGNFKVKLPTLPQHATKNLVDPKTNEVKNYNMFVAQRPDGTTYMINLTTYPAMKEQSGNEERLKEIVDELVIANPNNKVKSIQPSHFQNLKAIDFSIENGEMNIDGKAFMQDKTLYLLTMIANKTNYSSKDSDFFINSFQLLPVTSNLNSKHNP